MRHAAKRIFSAAVLAACLMACSGGTTVNFPGTKDGARALLGEFMKPGADNKKLTMELRPTKDDYRAVFKESQTADRSEVFNDKLWSSGNAVVAPKEGQTELILASATTEDFRNYAGEYSAFPVTMISLADNHLKDGVTFYAFKFVKPGETSGMAFEGLTHINGKWRLFPKPWRFLEEK